MGLRGIVQMRSIGRDWRMALIALAVSCLFIAGALSMPLDRGMGMHARGMMIHSPLNVTPEELEMCIRDRDSPLMKADAWIKKINNINQYFKKLFKIKNNNKWH